MKKLLIVWIIIQVIILGVAIIRGENGCVNVVASPTEVISSNDNEYNDNSVSNTAKTSTNNEELVLTESDLRAKDTSAEVNSLNRVFGAWITLVGVISMGIVYIIVAYLVLGLFINKEFLRKNRVFYMICAAILFVLAGTIQITKSFKPMIYLYPEEDNTKISVAAQNPEVFTCTYPEYNNGWNVIANRDGTLLDERGRHYYGLYWEGNLTRKKSFKNGFLVEGKDVSKFLEEKLEILGLNERESEEFIVYWLPILEKNKYNLIHFKQTEEINSEVPLNITPKPDTIIRVLMQYKAVPFKVNIEEQKLEKVERKGFTVVEWGGEAEEGLIR